MFVLPFMTSMMASATAKAYSRIDALFSEFKKNGYSSRQALEYQAKEG